MAEDEMVGRRGIASPVAIRRGEGAQRKRCRDPRCSPRVVELCVEPAGLCGRCTGDGGISAMLFLT